MRVVFVTKAAPAAQRRTFSLAQQLQRRFAGPLLRALQALQGRVNLVGVSRAISDGNVKGVLEFSNVDRVADIVADLSGELKLGVAAGGKAAAEAMHSKIAIDLGRPHIARWLKEHTGELITQVGDTSREAIRSIVEDGVLRGRHPAQMAKDVKQCIGLTDRQAKAVIRRRASLDAAGVPAARAQSIADRYSEKLLKQRAKLIASNEAMVAVNRGRFALWQQLEADGAMEPGQLQRWDTSEDEGVCPVCGPMNGQKVKLGAPFTTGDGGEVMHPPAHIGCRCVAGLV